MLHSLAYLISGVILFAMTAIYPAETVADNHKATLSGTVVDAENNEPVAEATITVVGKELSAETEKDGTFSFQDLEQGNYTLVVTAEGYPEQKLEVSVQSEHEEVTIELRSGY